MDGYREAWNSPLLQDIRRDLTQGRFHQYCLDSRACPIVRKLEEAHKLPARQAVRMQVRAFAARSPRAGRLLIRAKQATNGILKALTGSRGDG